MTGRGVEIRCDNCSDECTGKYEVEDVMGTFTLCAHCWYYFTEENESLGIFQEADTGSKAKTNTGDSWQSWSLETWQTKYVEGAINLLALEAGLDHWFRENYEPPSVEQEVTATEVIAHG